MILFKMTWLRNNGIFRNACGGQKCIAVNFFRKTVQAIDGLLKKRFTFGSQWGSDWNVFEKIFIVKDFLWNGTLLRKYFWATHNIQHALLSCAIFHNKEVPWKRWQYSRMFSVCKKGKMVMLSKILNLYRVTNVRIKSSFAHTWPINVESNQILS